MEGNRFRQLLETDAFALGMALTVHDPAVLEMAAHAGFGWVTIVTFSGQGGVGRMCELIRTAEAVQMPVLVNVPGPTPNRDVVAEALDFGADGVNVSLVSTPEEAANVVRMAKVPPLGDREVYPGGRLGKRWGMSMDDFTRRANEAVVGIKIETKEALEDLEHIVRVPGIDMVGVGVSDLSRSLGVRRDDPVITDAQQHAMKVTREAGVAYAKTAMSPEEVGEWVERESSLRIFMLATDGVQIGRAFRGLVQASDELVDRFAHQRLTGAASRGASTLQPWLTPEPADRAPVGSA